MLYNKLVRDNIPEIIKSKSEAVSFHVAGEEEFIFKLKEKLLEEASEFNKSSSIEELADLMEVIDALVTFYNFTPEDLAKIKAVKKSQRGAFAKRIILDES